MFRPGRPVVATAAAMLAALASLACGRPASAAEPLATTGGGRVTVSGNLLLRDGRPWTPHGVVQIAFVKAPAVPVGGYVKPFFAVAADDYTPLEYAGMRAQGVDSVRMQVGQPGLNEGGPYFSEAFVRKVHAAIRAARAAGLVVIVSMQDERQTGATTPGLLPDRHTIGAWAEIAPAFAQDRGVMFELYNEPELPVSPENWQMWKARMEAVARSIRATDPDNVLIADGLNFAESLVGAPLLRDRFGQVAYAVHPYAHAADDQTESRWSETFGDFATKAPVIVTEWNNGYFCDAATPEATKRFLHYLDGHGIGLMAATWDWQPANFGSVAYDFPDLKPTSYLSPGGAAACHEEATSGGTPMEHPVIPTGFGPGTMVQTWYRTGTPPDRVE